MPTIIDLSTLAPAQGFIVFGDANYDYAGHSVSGAGDVNGDGIDDIIIGAPQGNNGGSDAGEAYIIFGKAGTARTSIDLGTLTPADGFIIQGDVANDVLGFSVSEAGDVNGDGIGDIIVGAQGGDNGGSSAGEAYIIFGKTGVTRSDIDLTSLTASDGFIIQGDVANDQVGRSVSAAGDVNGDGIDDLVIGARQGDDGGSNAGEAYIVYGKSGATRTNIDLTGLTASDGFIIQGDVESDFAGFSVSSAGDFNGDGFDDVLVGARGFDGGGNFSGAAYLIFGKSGIVRGTVDLTGLAPSDGFRIQGDIDRDYAGEAVSGAGDINGDGFADIIVGASGASVGGIAYVIFGAAGATRADIDLTSFSTSDGFLVQGSAASDNIGLAVSNAGDFNDDGIDDIIIGSQTGDNGGADAGQAYIVFGKTGATRANIDVSMLDTADGLIIEGHEIAARVGSSVSQAGDINGDGGADVIVGAIFGDIGGSAAGQAYIIYGTASTPAASTVRGGAGGETLSGDAGANIVLGFGGDDVLNGLGGNDTLVGGIGNDSLSGGSGLNELIGGAGDDIYIVSESTDTIIELSSEGADEIQTIAAVMTNRANVETLRFTDNGAHVGVGLAQDDEIIGGSGVDQLFGRDGNDILRGGSGAANGLFGQGGDDTYYIDAVGDSAIENVGEGIDSVITSVSTLTLRINVENLSYSGNANFTGIGNASDNIMTGNGGEDFLSGLDGNDVLSGGAGLDLLIGGAGVDTFRISNAANADRILDFVSGVDKIALLGTAFTHSATIDYVSGTAAASTNSTFLYNSSNGVLSYDADGSGAGAAVAIANLGGGLVLSVGDFLFY